ncbi:radical SAM protein [Nannocystis sp.]|uniref:B12-binding domain-containing radical SAM protein n=1 Tax=Nannocystis sp. TaxID=1962667 RepID=UPI0025FEAB84|nr:radical SAM protein [Nannocystis sp.]MBK7824361.1 radical SAM protein [Nannocystis sp.]
MRPVSPRSDGANARGHGRGHGHDDEREHLRRRLAREVGTLGMHRPSEVALAYPSPYRAGMSSLGFQTLYRILHEHGVGAHRAFLPDAWEAMALEWPQPRRPILTYEAERPLSSYRIVGLSMAYELEITGVIRLLEGAGIPLLAADRGEHDPIVIAGGPLTFSNPSILLPFVDVLLSGECEELLPAAIDAILATPRRRAAIEAAADRPHACLGEVDTGRWSELPEPAKAPLERLPAHSAILTPDTELADMFLVEPERGCSRKCSFCVMRVSTNGGMRLLPMATPLGLVPDHARKVGLVGAAVTDHPELEALVAALVDSGRSVSISSLRADRLTPRFLSDMQRSGHRTITVASDGISERMRLLLERKIKEEHLVRAASLIHEHGFHRMKIYEMMGAPGETDADADELVRLALEIGKIQRLVLTFSTFVAKRNTPLDGQPFLGVKLAEDRLRRIREGLRGKVETRPQSPRWAHIEYFLAQGGPEAGHAAIQAVHAGARYADWLRAFADAPPSTRTLKYGDEAARARRKGKAADRPRGLPILL